MRDFANFLSQYLKEKGITYMGASKICGMDRTLLGRYCSGARLPKKAGLVESLAEGLGMSAEEKRELLESYRRTRVCREYHVEYHDVEVIIEGEHRLASVLPPEMEAGGNGRKAEGEFQGSARNLRSMEEILWMVRHILEGALWVKVLASPQYPKLRQVLQCMAADLPQECRIEQMIGIGQHEWKHGEKKLQNLERLLPLLLQERECQVYYHYQWESDAVKLRRELDFAITDKGMVLFSPGLEIGFFTDQREPCSYYGELYEDRKAMCRLFARGGQGEYERWRSREREYSMAASKAGISFWKGFGENCIWAVKEGQGCAACIEEMGTVQLLERFLWDMG